MTPVAKQMANDFPSGEQIDANPRGDGPSLTKTETVSTILSSSLPWAKGRSRTKTYSWAFKFVLMLVLLPMVQSMQAPPIPNDYLQKHEYVDFYNGLTLEQQRKSNECFHNLSQKTVEFDYDPLSFTVEVKSIDEVAEKSCAKMKSILFDDEPLYEHQENAHRRISEDYDKFCRGSQDRFRIVMTKPNRYKILEKGSFSQKELNAEFNEKISDLIKEIDADHKAFVPLFPLFKEINESIDELNAPKKYLCPVSKQIMTDPEEVEYVNKTSLSKHAYERSAIRDVVKNGNGYPVRDPMSRHIIVDKSKWWEDIQWVNDDHFNRGVYDFNDDGMPAEILNVEKQKLNNDIEENKYICPITYTPMEDPVLFVVRETTRAVFDRSSIDFLADKLKNGTRSRIIEYVAERADLKNEINDWKTNWITLKTIAPANIPERYLCPISKKAMSDPVSLFKGNARIGDKSYDRAAIKSRGKAIHPETKQMFNFIRADADLRNEIVEWRKAYGLVTRNPGKNEENALDFYIILNRNYPEVDRNGLWNDANALFTNAIFQFYSGWHMIFFHDQLPNSKEWKMDYDTWEVRRTEERDVLSSYVKNFRGIFAAESTTFKSLLKDPSQEEAAKKAVWKAIAYSAMTTVHDVLVEHAFQLTVHLFPRDDVDSSNVVTKNEKLQIIEYFLEMN